MVTFPKNLQAVITGDVVDSSKLGLKDRRLLPDKLRGWGVETRKAFPRAVPFNLDVFRGDSWQFVVSDPAVCVRVGLFFRACVIASSPPGRRLDTRMALAVETIDFVSRGRVSEGDGPAYRASGEALDALQDQGRMSFTSRERAGTQGLDIAIILLDAIVQEWTGRQALAIKGALQGWTQEKISQLWLEPISQQSVGRHLERAHWPAIAPALESIENSLKET